MSKYLIVLCALFTFTASASAQQTCDMSMSMSMSHKGAVKQKTSAEYKDLTKEQAADIAKRSLAVIADAQSAEGKRGDYTFKFDGANTCGVSMSAIDPVDGLTHRDATKVWRRAFAVSEGTIKMSEKHAAKGHKGPWGKDRD